jgi:hypothetical protein
MAHACGPHTVEAFLASKGARARALFDGVERMIASLGPYEVAPARTRVAFMVRTRFASVNRLSDRAMSIHIVLTRRRDHPRVRKVEPVGDLYVHHLRISSLSELDDELRDWLAESRREMGEQARLASR